MVYRNDVDGLRAIAVISVVLFHLDLPFIPGGYAGVDIFFVISGFLISSIIIKQVENATFSFQEFYTRRIRRLLPAAMAVYGTTLFLFTFIFPTDYFQDVTLSIISSIFFVSNIYFWQKGGYFGEDLEINPMLHTWSLSVEEQFYLLFPLAIFLVYRFTQNRLIVLSLVILSAIISLSLAITYTPSKISYAGFYLLPVRVYELAIGVIAAIVVYSDWLKGLRSKPSLSLIGLVFILTSLLFFDEETPFPSYSALLPTIGTALFLMANNHFQFVHFLVTNKISVGIGLISYSMYLWHWPLIVAKNWLIPEMTSLWVTLILFGLSCLMAFISWKYIEQPFRDKSKFNNKKVVKYACSSAISIVLLCGISHSFGNSALVDPEGNIAAVKIEATSPEPYRRECVDKIKLSLKFSRCLISEEKSNGKNILLWGDSHGSAFVPALSQTALEHNVYIINNTGCLPLAKITGIRNDYGDCQATNKIVWEHIEESKYDLILLAGAYNNYLNWEAIRHTEQIELSSSEAFVAAIEWQDQQFKQLGIDYLVIPQGPRFKNHVPNEFVRKKILGKDSIYETFPMAKYISQRRDFDNAKSQIPSIKLLDVMTEHCKQDKCASNDPETEKLLYKDRHHISNHFASQISSKVAKQIQGHFLSM